MSIAPSASKPADPRPLPRGLRNANPGNIRHAAGVQWRGAAAVQPDTAFVAFIDPVWGIRALAKVLLTYQKKHGLRTVAGIIGRWAPPTENDTASYVRSVCTALGVTAFEPLSLTDPARLRPLLAAIIQHENGRQPYPPIVLDRAIFLAGLAVPGMPDAETPT